MSADRFVVLGLARVGAPWFKDVAHWATSAALPVEFIKAISADEAKVRLATGRVYSALLVDESVVGFDRDLLLAAAEHGCAVLVVSSGGPGVTLVEPSNLLPREFTRDDLLRALNQACAPVDRRTADRSTDPSQPIGLRGRVVTVTGAGGTGTSTIAMAIAQQLAADARWVEHVCLADCSLLADQGTLHDAPDVVPSVLELCDAHRLGHPSTEDVRALTWRIHGRGYHLLLGLRQRRDWTSLRSRAFESSLESLRAAFRLVVVDTDDELDSERATGSVDLDERNAMARLAVTDADVVVITGTPDLLGIHHLLRVTRDVLEVGVSPRRVLPVFNRSFASRRQRAQVDRAFGELLEVSGSATVATPLHIPWRKGIELALRDGQPLPDGWVEPVTIAVNGLLGHDRPARRRRRAALSIVPGEVGSWSGEEPRAAGGDG